MPSSSLPSRFKFKSHMYSVAYTQAVINEMTSSAHFALIIRYATNQNIRNYREQTVSQKVSLGKKPQTPTQESYVSPESSRNDQMYNLTFSPSQASYLFIANFLRGYKIKGSFSDLHWFSNIMLARQSDWCCSIWTNFFETWLPTEKSF